MFQRDATDVEYDNLFVRSAKRAARAALCVLWSLEADGKGVKGTGHLTTFQKSCQMTRPPDTSPLTP